jgi:hypothetical protein
MAVMAKWAVKIPRTTLKIPVAEIIAAISKLLTSMTFHRASSLKNRSHLGARPESELPRVFAANLACPYPRLI